MSTLRVAETIAAIGREAWDRCAHPDGVVRNPFLSFDFLDALERAGTVGGRTGWRPMHLALDDGRGGVAAVMPLYLKTHSKGEYVFDHGWAEAYERAGGQYYPKLQSAVPFTPVPGRRMLVRAGVDEAGAERALIEGARELSRRLGASSLHITFMTEGEWERAAGQGLLKRWDRQFHWRNAGYATFEDFLASLASRKRKAVRKERQTALAEGITIRRLAGAEIEESHWDALFAFYQDTGGRKWGRPYLNRRFFSLLGERMADNCLLVLAFREGRTIAGALNLVGAGTLYGRYWGAIEQHPCLHFEVCYYQAIEHAIANRLLTVEAGAQGEHKLARGYVPVVTYSAHDIADPGFRRAVADYLERERAAIAEEREELAAHGPFRKGGEDGEAA